MRHSAATGTSNETPAGHRNSPKDRVEAPFSYILDAQSNLAVLAHARGAALELHLGLNHPCSIPVRIALASCECSPRFACFLLAVALRSGRVKRVHVVW